MAYSTTAHTLELIASLKLSTVLGTAEDTRLEASGICRVAPAFYVIFDNRADLACLGGLGGL